MSSERDRLTRRASSDEIHAAAPRAAVEGSQVRPDRSRLQTAVLHARDQDCGCVSFPLNVTDGSQRGDGESDTELETSNPGT